MTVAVRILDQPFLPKILYPSFFHLWTRIKIKTNTTQTSQIWFEFTCLFLLHVNVLT